MNYQDQIKSPRWQKKRLEILKRDEFTCTNCGNKESTLHVHHKHYNKGAMIWDYQGWELTTLCETCHELQHNTQSIILGKYEIQIINNIRKIPDEVFIEFVKFIDAYCDIIPFLKHDSFFQYLSLFCQNTGSYLRLNNNLSIIFGSELLLSRVDELENKLEKDGKF